MEAMMFVIVAGIGCVVGWAVGLFLHLLGQEIDIEEAGAVGAAFSVGLFLVYLAVEMVRLGLG